MNYDYTYLLEEINQLENVFTIGKTSGGRDIFCIPLGNGETTAVFAGAFHGLEYLTTYALIDFAHKFSETPFTNSFRLFIIPMVNPDGVDIAINGINPKNSLHHKLIDNVGIISFTKKWQANSNGVDINHNFDAAWQPILDNPSASKFGGKNPESELETQAIANFLRLTEPTLFIAFHSQGKEIYYDFNNMENKSSKEIAEKVAQKFGYTAVHPKGTAGFGGAKDWYIKEYHKQAFTIELGKGTNPLPHSQLEEMKKDTYNICMEFLGNIF